MMTRVPLLAALLLACNSSAPPSGGGGTGGSAGSGGAAGMPDGGAGGGGGVGGGGASGGEGGSGGGGGSGGQVPICDFGNVACGGKCVKFDATHCGSCDRTCGDGQICSSGLCVRTCTPDWGSKPQVLMAPAAALARADLDGDGMPELIAAGDGVAVVSRGEAGLAVKQVLTSPAHVNSVAAGDVDGDGDLDVVIESGGKLWILSNDRGTLGTPVAAGDAGAEVNLALADLDLDGKADLVALREATADADGVLYFLHGTGTLFTSAVTLTSAPYVTNPLVGELDASPGTDLIFGTSNPQPSVQTWHGLETGPRVDSITPLDEAPVTLASGDIDGDGQTDLVVSTADADRPGTVFRILGSQNGAGQVSPDLPTGRVQLADVDGDGKLDLIAGTNLLLGNGQGGFQKPLGLRATPDPEKFLAIDVDGDGRTDLVGASPSGSLEVYPGTADHGYFGVPVALDILDPPVAIGMAAAVDRTGKGWLDLAVLPAQGDRGSFFSNSGKGRLARSDTVPVSNTSAVAWAQIAGSWYLAAAGSDSTHVLRYRSGVQTAIALPAMSGVPTALALADLDGDSQGDLVAAQGTSLLVLYGDADSLTAPLAMDVPAGATAVAVGDLNKDGRADLVVAVGSAVCTVLGKEGRAFETPACRSPSGVRALALGDLNDDGYPDLVVSLLVGVQSWIGKGDGSFVFNSKLSPKRATDLQLQDVDGDYAPELLATGGDVGGFQSLLIDLDGSGAVQSTEQVGPAVEPNHAFLADVDGDGVVDLISLEAYGAVLSPGLCPTR